MTKPTPRRKRFRRKMWAYIAKDGFAYTQRLKPKPDDLVAMVHPGARIARVLITELPRKGRDGK